MVINYLLLVGSGLVASKGPGVGGAQVRVLVRGLVLGQVLAAGRGRVAAVSLIQPSLVAGHPRLACS
jgi:hypothetical protein